MAKCKYCGFDAERMSGEDGPAKPNWKRYLGRAVVIGTLCHWATHLAPVALAIAMITKGC